MGRRRIDSVPLTSTQRALVADWMPVVSHIAREFSPSKFFLFDDAMSDGTMGLIRAAQLLDPTNPGGASFIRRKIRGAILDGMRSRRWFGERHGADGITVVPLEDVASVAIVEQPGQEVALALRQARARCDPADWNALGRWAIRGEELQAIAAERGCHKSSVTRRVQRVKRAILKCLPGPDVGRG